MLKEHDIVTLKGTIVYIYKDGEYEVEIVDDKGQSNLLTLSLDRKKDDRPKR